jgi:hypothetical protein
VNDTNLTEEYRARIYVGTSSKRTDPDFSLEKALEDAYEQAKADGAGPPYRVLETRVEGENPLSDYIVALKAGG